MNEQHERWMSYFTSKGLPGRSLQLEVLVVYSCRPRVAAAPPALQIGCCTSFDYQVPQILLVTVEPESQRVIPIACSLHSCVGCGASPCSLEMDAPTSIGVREPAHLLPTNLPLTFERCYAPPPMKQQQTQATETFCTRFAALNGYATSLLYIRSLACCTVLKC